MEPVFATTFTDDGFTAFEIS